MFRAVPLFMFVELALIKVVQLLLQQLQFVIRVSNFNPEARVPALTTEMRRMLH